MAQQFQHWVQRSERDYEIGNGRGTSYAGSSRVEEGATSTRPPEYLGTARDAPYEQFAQGGSHPGLQAMQDLGPRYSVTWDSRGGTHFSARTPVTDGIHSVSPPLGAVHQQYAQPSARLNLPASQPVERDSYDRSLAYGHQDPRPSHATAPYGLISPPDSGAGTTRPASEHFIQAPSGMVTHLPPVWHPGHKGPVSLHVPFAAPPTSGPVYAQPGLPGILPPQPDRSYSWYSRSHTAASAQQAHPSPLAHASTASHIDSESWARQYGTLPAELPRFPSSATPNAAHTTAHTPALPTHSHNMALPTGNNQHLPDAQDALHMVNALARGAGARSDNAFADASEQSVSGLPLSFQLMTPNSPHPEYYALERIPAAPEARTQQYVHSHSAGTTASPIASEAHASAPHHYCTGSASSNPGDSPNPLAAFLHHGQAYSDDRSFSDSPNGSPWLHGSSYGTDLATMVSGLNSSIPSSASGSPGAAQEFRHDSHVVDGSQVLASVLASGGQIAPGPIQPHHDQSFVLHGQQADAQYIEPPSKSPVPADANPSAAGGTKGRALRIQKKADKHTTSLKKEVRLEEGRCETCSVVFADIYLRGVVDDFKPAFKLRYICIACHGSDSHGSALAGSLAKKRARALDPMTSAVCDVCSDKVAIGGPVPQNDEDDLLFNLEIVCSRCKERYSRCSDCGGGGGVRLGVGKWRCRELFTPGRKTCRLSHARQASVASMQYVTNRIRDIRREELPEILNICKGVFSSAIYSTVAVPEILERGTTAAKCYQDVVDMVEIGWQEGRMLIEEDIEDTLHSRRYLGLRYSAPRPRKSASRKAPAASVASDSVSPPAPAPPIVYASEGSLLRTGMHLAGYVTGEWDVYKGSFYISCSVPYSTGEQYEGAAHLISLLVKRAIEDRRDYVAELIHNGNTEEAARILPILHVWTMLFFTPESKLSTFLESKRQLIPLERYLEKYPDTDPTIFPPYRPVAPRVRDMPGWCCLVRRNILPSTVQPSTAKAKQSGSMRAVPAEKVVAYK